MKILRKALGVLLALTAALTLLALLIQMQWPQPLPDAVPDGEHAPASATGLAEEDYPKAAAMIADYLAGRTDTFQLAATVDGTYTETAFSGKEQQHMADVRELFVLARGIALGGALVCAVLLLVCWLLRRSDGAAMAGFRWGIGALLLVLAALLAWGMVDFDSLFILFHHLAFTNDLWLLNPATDLLIRLMPVSFFVHYAALIGGTWLGTLCLLGRGGVAREEASLKRSPLPRAPSPRDEVEDALGGEAASLREAPLPPDPSLPKSGWRLRGMFLRGWFRLSVSASPITLSMVTAALSAAVTAT